MVAHLDTVFPEGTDVKVKRDGTKLLAPGVSDDSRGLAVMLAAVRVINGAGIDTDADLLFVGSVGEEGEGDLRGVRYLFDKGKYKDQITAFLGIDGAGAGRSSMVHSAANGIGSPSRVLVGTAITHSVS